MNLRNRSLLLLGLIFFVLFIVFATASFGVTLSGLGQIEETGMKKAVGQVVSSLDGESQALLSTAQDWAWWDDMAAFADGKNAGFVERNANTDNLATIKVHLFLILDRDGKVIHSMLLSPDFQEYAPIPEDVEQSILNNSRFASHTADDPGVSGILSLPGGPMVVASTPILLSDMTGPSHGTVIMGRYIQYGPIQRIDSSTGYNVQLFWKDQGNIGHEAIPVAGPAGPGSLVLKADNESTITGYNRVQDIAGRDIVIGVTMERDLYRTGLASIQTYLLLLLLWAIMTGLIVVVVIDRTVLRRIELLTDRVRALPENRGDIPQPVLSGNDELAVLEQSILASRADLLLSERQLRVFIDALPDPAALYSRDGTILIANTALAGLFGKRPDELKGSPIRALLPEELDKYLAQANEAIRTRSVVQYETESGGKTLLITHYPVLDARGEVIQIGLLSLDISERKRLENALRQVTKKIALLNTVIFNDIQNKIFVQRGYQELLRSAPADPRLREYLDKEEAAVKEIQSSLQFAKQYSDMGINPPRWQDVNKVMVYAISHLDLGSLHREFRLDGLEIYADSLLERVFFNLVENIIRHAHGATVIRSGYVIAGGGATIFIEDDGAGIPVESKERIFEKGVGTGGAVGLFLSREILSTTGITIRETGVPGQGARFEITVPAGSFRLTGA